MTTSSSRPQGGSCHDAVRKRAEVGGDAANQAEVPPRGGLLGAHLAGRPAAVVALLAARAEPYVLLGDTCIIGFFFIAGTVFFEKQERTLGAVISTPLRFWEYLWAKLAVLVLVSLLVAFVVPTIAHGFAYRPIPLIAGVLLGTLLMLLVGFVSSLPFASISDWFLARRFRWRF